nr:proteoglycan Cow [Leptinotarsa decemlineata]
MRLILLMFALAAVIYASEAKRKRKFEGDFEFDEEDENRTNKSGEKKRWIHDPSSDLCRPLNCKKKEICLLEDTFTAVCVSRKELKKNGDIVVPKSAAETEEPKEEDDDVFYDTEDDLDNDSEDSGESVICKPCPVVKPIFLCGSDNRTYSSLCRLDYHNCIHRTSIRVGCKGFCPCVGEQRQLDKNNMMYAEDKERLRGYNEVLDNKIYSGPILGTPIYPPKQCSPAALQAMGNRLLDWFSVVMADSSKRRRMKNKSKVHFPMACKGEVRWMFQHLDTNVDSKLSLQELYDLEHDQSEVCLKPFLQQCDADRDVVVTPSEWCRCFQRTERPCVAVKHKITSDFLGVYVPDCDSQGYYNPVQCHGAIGMCWCVDKHGVEFANTRTHAKPNCESLVHKPNDFSKQIATNSVEHASDDEDGDDGEQDVEGSADHPTDY